MKQEEKKIIGINFYKQLKVFICDIQELMHNHELTKKQAFLEKISRDISSLYASSIKVQEEMSDDLKDIGVIIQNIFTQTLSVKSHPRITTLKAVQLFKEKNEKENDLSDIMQEYLDNPESTKNFIQKLKLLRRDLNEVLKKIA